ncbi:protein kinase [Coemansia sp. RSA 2706]|nr:protein kinase [Coemansia sp. RSA 2706]
MPETSTVDFEVPLPESSGKIVDFSDFEHQKENIQPLRRGRSAAALAQLYGTKDSGLNSAARHSLQPLRPLQPATSDTHTGMDEGGLRMSSHLQAQNAQYQAEIAALDPVEADDPLDVYFRYIQWLLEVFPQAQGNAMVIKLVEQPLKLFRGEERYRNDARFVKLWIWYTGIIGEGQEAVFQFLAANQIGDSLAVMYEEYAKLLEALGKVPKADEVYRLGVARKAQPLARLRRRFDEFQRRVMARTMRDVEQQQQQQSGAEAESGQRAVTDENAGGNAQRTMLGTKRSGKSVRSAAANTLAAGRRGLPEHAEPGARPNSRIQVFSDPAGGGSGAAATANGPWRDIGTDESRRKENLPEAGSWRGQKLEQRRGGAGTGANQAAREKFTVFSDSGTGGPGAPDASASAQLLPPCERSADEAGEANMSQPAAPKAKAKAKSKDKSKDKTKTKEKTKAAERMVMPDAILYPRGDGVPQCVEEARAQLARYRLAEDGEPQLTERRGASSPTINTRVAQQDMLEIWNNMSDSDSDTDSLRGGRDAGADAAGSRAADDDGDDYQFTMGPVTPNVVPRGAASLRPAMPQPPPSSARPSRFESFLGAGGDSDDANPPTLVLNSMRAAKRRELQQARLKPTPLAARTQTPQQIPELRSIDEGSQPEDNEGESLMRALGAAKTPMSARIAVFRDSPPAPDAGSGARPQPLFSSLSPPAAGSQSPEAFECDYPPICSADPSAMRHSTPARYPHTPGTGTRTASGYSVSGAELTGLSGFTGMSTIGPGTASTFLTQGASALHARGPRAAADSHDEDTQDEDEEAEDVEDEHREPRAAQTPMRKRLSMAAKDLGRITPRFPKTPPGSAQQYSRYATDDDDDDDDDEADEDDDPCTENIGEFADLDSQMNDLQMELGASFMRPEPPAKSAPLFTIFRD